jgi:hypothetical protein
MAKYQQTSTVTGAWVKGVNVVNGSKCKLVSEAKPIPSQFKDSKGNDKTQDVAKIRFDGEEGDAKNISLNRATINALVEAFGDESAAWQGQPLTAQTEKVVVTGKRVTAVYLIPDGFELGEDENGFVVIKRKGEKVSAVPEEESINYGEGEVSADELGDM